MHHSDLFDIEEDEDMEITAQRSDVDALLLDIDEGGEEEWTTRQNREPSIEMVIDEDDGEENRVYKAEPSHGAMDDIEEGWSDASSATKAVEIDEEDELWGMDSDSLFQALLGNWESGDESEEGAASESADIEECESVADEELYALHQRSREAMAGADEEYPELDEVYKQQGHHFKTHTVLATKLYHLIRMEKFDNALHLCQESRLRQQRAGKLATESQMPALSESRPIGGEISKAGVELWGIRMVEMERGNGFRLVSTIS